MGISGLLPLLKEAQEPGHISHFKGKRVMADGDTDSPSTRMSGSTRAPLGCAEDLVKGKKTVMFVNYAMHRVRMLRMHGVEPFLVFDGGPLPAKQGTEDSRAKSRADHLARAQAFEAQNRPKDARDCYTKCIDITPEMAYQLIKALKADSVQYIVAPYEADAQLCYLEKEGYVDGIITEDSDLLVFGCKTVIFKMDKDGSCVYIKRSNIATVRDLPMHGWTDTQFRRMAMLSGCDYLPSIVGIGLKKAHRMLRRLKTVERVIQSIRLEGSHVIPDGYIEAFNQAELAFLHQRVYCPERKRLVPLHDLPPSGLSIDDQKWVGLDVEPEIAQGMALGDLHPATRKPIDDQWPEFDPTAGSATRPPGISGSGSMGTLDGFVTITRTRSTPRVGPVVTPVGHHPSGPTTISQLAAPRSVSQPAAKGGFSKYFQKKPPVVEEKSEAETLELHWEEEDEVESQPKDLLRSPTPEVHRQSSPFLSSSVAGEEPTPASVRLSSPSSHISSPNSTPYKGIPFSSPIENRVNQWGRSPSPAPTERSEPPSPTPTKRVLVAASSQFSEIPGVTLPYSGDPTPTRRKINVLVPASSQAAELGVSLSSDSAPDKEIVSPTPDEQKKPKRKRAQVEEEEQTEEEMALQRRASIVAEGWRAKYTFGSSSSPASASTSLHPRPVKIAPMPKTAKMPLTSAVRVLAARDMNVMSGPVGANAKAKGASASKPPPPPPKPKSHGMSCAALQKFRFTRPRPSA